MKRDDPPLANDGNFDQVVPQSLVTRTFVYVAALIGMLLGPALVITLLLAGELAWQGWVGGLAVTIFIGGFSLAEWMSTVRQKRRMDRLRLRGRPAVAQVISSAECLLGEETGTELMLRISGEAVPEFETRHRGPDHRMRALGKEFSVIVDPADNIYMIVR